MKKRVSEIITIEDVKKWNEGEIITIAAGTGAGKSYFVKNILYAFAKANDKKILFLIHRTNCVNQFQKEIERDEKTDTIHIKTYQFIETKIKNNKAIDFSEYQYIVCDEFHYFMSDASFNKTTDISLNTILNENNKIRIFMSATGEHVQKYINNIKKMDTINYKVPITYDFIKTLSFFNKNETLEKFIEECIEGTEKAIFFIESAQKAYDLYKKYEKYCLFNCSKSNKKYYQYVNKDKINNMLENEKFEEQILITTTCMDAGVNIIDQDLLHIVCDVEDIGTLIQCIGRKRQQNKDDKIYLYIHNINNKQLGGKKTQINIKIKMAQYLRKHTVKEFIQEFQREYDCSNIVYDDIVQEDNKSTKKINELMYFKCLIDKVIIDNMIAASKKYGYTKYVRKLFNKKDSEVRILEESYQKETLEEYLDKIAGKKLFKEEQKELINMIDLKQDGKQLKSFKSFNACFDENKIPYMIISKEDKRRKLENGTINKNRGKTYWEVVKTILE